MQTTQSDAPPPGRFIQFLCGLRGHDQVLHFEGRRVMMRCTSCGHDTPGWTTGKTASDRKEVLCTGKRTLA